jgi:hypothetical protein
VSPFVNDRQILAIIQTKPNIKKHLPTPWFPWLMITVGCLSVPWLVMIVEHLAVMELSEPLAAAAAE